MFPSITEAENILKEAEINNPGKWILHSKNVAKASYNIALKTKILDPERAYISGLLHDIGRFNKDTKMRHIICGYNFAKERNYEEISRICLTHSFPDKNPSSAIINWNGTDEELDFIKNYIKNVEYNDYDRLIQLTDVLANHNGFCIIEIRLVDIALRHSINEWTIQRWKTIFSLKAYFDKICDCDIYSLLPGIEKNLSSN